MKWSLNAPLKFLPKMKTNTTSNFARRHHTVQQSYLAHFTPTGEVGGVLYAHDLEGLKSWASSTAGVAFEKDFYRVDLPGFDPDVIEKGFGHFEALAVSVLRSILNENRIPADKDYEILMTFIAFQIIRVPAIRESFVQADYELFRQILRQNASLPDDELEARLEPLKRANPEFSNIAIEDFRKFVESDAYTVKASQNTQMRTFAELLSNVGILAALLGQRKWSLLIADECAGSIVTSDQPVNLNWTDKTPDRYERSPGYGLKNTVVHVPLSKTAMLRGRFDGESGEIVYLNESLVAGLNNIVIHGAKRFVYSTFKEFAWKTWDGSISGVSDLFRRERERRDSTFKEAS